MKSEPTPSDHEVLTGLVERVTYQNAENGFCVLRIKERPSRLRLIERGQSSGFSRGARGGFREGRDRNLRLAFGLVAASCSGENAGCTENSLALAAARSRKINGLRSLHFAHANQLIFVQARLSSGWGTRLVLGDSPCAAPPCTSASVRGMGKRP